MRDKKEYAMQNSIHSLLHIFYTGSGLSLGNKLAYPYFLINDKTIKRKIKEIIQIVSSLEGTEEKETLLGLSSQLEKKKFFFSKDIIHFINLNCDIFAINVKVQGKCVGVIRKF